MTEDADPLNLAELAELAEELPLDSVLDALSNPLARYALYYVLEERTVSLDRLADVVAGWSNACTHDIVTPDDRDRTLLLLYHVHLPKLDSIGVIDFDSAAKTAALNDPSPALVDLVHRVRRIDDCSGRGVRDR